MKKYTFNINNKVKLKIEDNHDKCIGCGQCTKNCPMLNAHCKNPKDLLASLSDDSYFDGTSKTTKMPFTCTLCGYCDAVCPKDVHLKDMFHSLKVDIVSQIGYPGEFGKTSLEMHQNLGFSSLFSSNLNRITKSSITKDESVNSGKGPILFFPGCSPSAHSPETITRVFDYLSSHESTVLYSKCCGKPTQAVGNMDKFNGFTRPLMSEINSIGPSEVIVLCMNCYNIMSDLFPDIKIRTLWEFMAQHGLPNDFKPIKAPVFGLHDPCPTRNHVQIHDSVRQVLKMMQIEYEEFEFNRDLTVCCGSGGMLSLISPDLASNHKVSRAEDSPRDHILTYCQECTESLKHSSKDTVHILDLLFDYDNIRDFNQTTKGTIKKWLHRYKVKTISDKVNKA